MMTIGERLKALRTNIGITSKEVAEKIGVSSSTYSKLENDKKSIDPNELTELVKLFNTSADYILGIEQENQDIILYMKKEKHLSDDEIKEVQFILSLMDEADHINKMEERYL